MYITETTIKKCITHFGSIIHETSLQRFQKGVAQAAQLWQEKDGTEQEFIDFCTKSFITDDTAREMVFKKLDYYFEQLYGNFNAMSLGLLHHLHLDTGELHEVDSMFGSFSPSAHMSEDLFTQKIAFYVMLNFPRFTLEEKQMYAHSWSPLEWAYARLGDYFIERIPATLRQKNATLSTQADAYISEFNIFMGNLKTPDGTTLFPKDIKLITHWGLRDELKSQYAHPDGLERQRMIYRVMTHITEQTIPTQAINNPSCEWAPATNTIVVQGITEQCKPDTQRYELLFAYYNYFRESDTYYPLFPTVLQRRFDMTREMSYEDVESLFLSLMTSPVIKEIGNCITRRLGRPLEAFDIWYDGFKPRSSVNEDMLSEKTRALYPTPLAFEKDLPNILKKLGFSDEQISFIAPKVQVDPSRGAGHAWGAGMHTSKARLRTRIAKTGMDYKGFNIAVHEFGHNVEQTLSLHKVPHYTLHGIPFTAFTEAFAFVFQHRDLALLGITDNNPQQQHLAALDATWMTYEIMGMALTEMRLWKWIYSADPKNADEIKENALRIARETWNEFFAPVFGIEDQTILGVYSHTVDYPLYLADYPLGHVIEFQIERYLEGKNLGAEMERMCAIGSILPQEWMKRAVGQPISTQPMLSAAEKALTYIS